MVGVDPSNKRANYHEVGGSRFDAHLCCHHHGLCVRINTCYECSECFGTIRFAVRVAVDNLNVLRFVQHSRDRRLNLRRLSNIRRVMAQSLNVQLGLPVRTDCPRSFHSSRCHGILNRSHASTLVAQINQCLRLASSYISNTD